MNKIKKMMFVSGLCLAEIMLIFSVSASPVHATIAKFGTQIHTNIVEDTTLEPSGNPHFLSTDVTVFPNVTLRIMPGVTIEFIPRIPSALLTVHGTLEINGTRESPVDISGIGIKAYGNVSVAYANIHNSNITALHVLRDPNSGILPVVSIHNSSIADNSVAVNNETGQVIHMENNWWGSVSGPVTSGINSVQGSVSYTPWLTYDPTNGQICCSNIIFIPGLEGTRMYSGSNQLWEPNRNADVSKLYLDVTGSSTIATIYSGSAIGRAYGVKTIYGKFLSFLEDLSRTGDVNETRVYGYDWRKSIADVVTKPERKATDSVSLLNTVAQMASTSKTGKVTLIAHSNGGLVAKYLLKTLNDLGKADVIDKVISVAVPYLGTPEAILGLLHGDHQAILGGLILSQATMRGLGENMASAYSLLPSAQYFTKIFTPSITFASTTTVGTSNGFYPQNIISGQDQTNFINDVGGARSKPAFSDTRAPTIGNGTLSVAAQVLHGVLDTFMWPATVAKWAIIGWNKLTTLSVNYDDRVDCKIKFLVKVCRYVSTHTASSTIMGDGTVISPSASYDAGPVISIDLALVSQREKSNYDHANILESSSTQALIKQIIYSNDPIQPLALSDGTSSGEPNYASEGSSSLLLSTHSPVELHIYDTYGNHTGIIPKSPELSQNDFVIGEYEAKIPGSNFRISENGDGDFDTYIRLPNGDKQNYSVVINGTDFGFFTFEMEKFVGETSVEKVKYSTEPVSPISIATTTITGGKVLDGKINVDIDADGLADYHATPGGTGLPGNAVSIEDANTKALALSSEVIKKTIKTIMADKLFELRGKSILKRVDHIVDLAKRGKLKQSEVQTERLIKRLGHIKIKKISLEEKERLIKNIELILDVLVTQ